LKSYQKIFYFTLAISVLVILIVAGKYFSLVFLAALGLWLGHNTSEKEKKVEEEIKAQKQSQTALFNRTQELEKRFEQLKNASEARRKGKKPSNLLLFIFLVFTAMLSKPVSAADNLYIPESYEELRALYILVDREVRVRDELIGQYQALIADYENTICELNQLVQRLQEINSEKDLANVVKKEINALQKRRAWGITGGLNVGDELGYSLGIIHVRGVWGWQINYAPSGLLSLGLSIYL